MKINDDFLLISKEKKNRNIKCFNCGVSNSKKDIEIYLTEWELSTGASTDGIYYCRTCIEEH